MWPKIDGVLATLSAVGLKELFLHVKSQSVVPIC